MEILFDRQSTKNLKSGTLQALQNEIEQRLKPHYPEIWLHMWESPSFRAGSCQPALH
ncbi:impC protein [Escherichia coli]|nr:impC protein [Escherichia coli]